MKKKQQNGYTINIQRLFRDTVDCQFRIEKNDKGKPTGNNPFNEIMFFIKHDLEETFLSIEWIAKRHGRKSIITDDIVEYYSIVGRPKLYEE